MLCNGKGVLINIDKGKGLVTGAGLSIILERGPTYPLGPK